MWKYGYMEMCFHVSSLGGQLSSSGNKGSEPICDNNKTMIDLPYTKFVDLYSTINDMIICVLDITQMKVVSVNRYS